MTVALLNGLLGGDFLEDRLREDAGWAMAIDKYIELLNAREAEFRPKGEGKEIPRASGLRSKRLAPARHR